MSEYDELVSNLRSFAKVYSICENENTNEYRLAVQAADAITDLTSAQRTGRWYMEHHTWFCDQCGKNPTKGMGYVQGTDELYSYCPNCGAKMGETE